MKRHDLVFGFGVKKIGEVVEQQCLARGRSGGEKGRDAEGYVVGKLCQGGIGGRNGNIVRGMSSQMGWFQ